MRLAPILAGLMLSAVMAGCIGESTTSSSTSTAPEGPYHVDCSISNWAEPCLAMASPNDSPAKTEIDIAVNPTDPLNAFVASKDKDPLASPDCVWAVGQYTLDGGKTWNTTYVGKQIVERLPTDLLFGWECITDPILAYEPDGTLHYSLQAYRYRPGGLGTQLGGNAELGFMFQAISYDKGVTFPTVLLMHAGDSGAIFHDFMRMGTSPTTGTTFTIWNQLTGLITSEPVLVAVDSGQTVARPPVYFPNTVSPFGLGVSAVFGGKDGTVYAWLSGFNSGGRAVLATSSDDGLTFDAPRQVFSFVPMADLESHGDYDPQYRTGTVVELAPDLSEMGKGCLYAVWAGNEAEAVGGSDIYVRTSCDKGTTWSEPVLVNSQAREDAQWMPRVSVDGHGTIHIVYYTRAYDPDHNLIDAEWAYSMDGGANWTQTRLTTTSFDGNLGIHQDGFPFMGDYIGASSVGDHTYLAFPHTLTGRAEIAVAHVVADGSQMHMHMP